jgi:glycosyltransferase involved in cell wall biosynthesis
MRAPQLHFNEMKSRIAVVYAPPAGLGGWGYHVATVLSSLADGDAEVHAIGPQPVAEWPLRGGVPPVIWHQPPNFLPNWKARYTSLRWQRGRIAELLYSAHGRWASEQLDRLCPDRCYIFTEVGLESLRWARRAGVPAVLDSATGHLRPYLEVNEEEFQRWASGRYRGTPNEVTIERAEEEYRLAERIRVVSKWTRDSLAANGVEAKKITVLPLPINIERYRPFPQRLRSKGPLRVCYVGSLGLAKGFPYLLRAVRALGPERVSLEIVGATGDRWCRRLLEREGAGLGIRCASGDPGPAYRRAELLAFPTLFDGFGLVVAEAMACGLPVIVTEACGAAEWVRPGETGWILPAGNIEALAKAMEEALRRRAKLPAMGSQARAEIERLTAPDRFEKLREWFYSVAPSITLAACQA